MAVFTVYRELVETGGEIPLGADMPGAAASDSMVGSGRRWITIAEPVNDTSQYANDYALLKSDPAALLKSLGEEPQSNFPDGMDFNNEDLVGGYLMALHPMQLTGARQNIGVKRGSSAYLGDSVFVRVEGRTDTYRLSHLSTAGWQRTSSGTSTGGGGGGLLSAIWGWIKTLFH